MIAITPQMRVLVAIEPADFRCGIDGLSYRCRSVLKHNPFAGTVIVFRNRAGKAIKLLVYDGQGFCKPPPKNPQSYISVEATSLPLASLVWP